MDPSAKDRVKDTYLGDYVSLALAKVGITETRIQEWLGLECGCSRRRERINSLHRLTKRILQGRIEKAREYLESLLSEE